MDVIYETVANQTFRRIFRNSNFFETDVHLGTLTFQKNLNHKNFLENFDLRQSLYRFCREVRAFCKSRFLNQLRLTFMNPVTRNFLLLLLLSAAWGPSFLFIKVAVHDVPPIMITAVRMGIASLILYAVLKFYRIKLPALKPILKHFTVAALLQGAIPFTLFDIAERTADSAFASIFRGITPLFTMVLAHYFIVGDSFTKKKLYGGILGFIGLFVLIMPALLNARADMPAIILMIMAASCFSIAFIYTKKFIDVPAYSPLAISAIQLFISFVVLTIASLIFENPWHISHISQHAVISLINLGIISTALAFVVYYKLLATANVTYIAMANYIVPVFGVMLGILFLHEKLAWNSYLGGGLILIGVMTTNGLLSFSKLKAKITAK